MMKVVLEFVALTLLIWRSSSQTAVVIPPSLVGVEGRTLNVTCSLENGTRPTFVLRVDGTRIQDTGKLQGAAATDGGTRFVYGPLLRNESGFTFLCDDQLGNTASATLDVYWNEPFTFNASSTTVDEGGEVNITVTFSANPRPTISLERQDGNAIPDEQTRVITTDVSNDMSRLTFRDLREGDTGNYSVQVAVPGDVRREPISLTVVRGNDPFTFSASSTTVNEGDEVNITVTFSASPRPTVSLERQDGNAIPDEQDRVITTNVSNDMSQLTFQDLREQDTGNYSVLVEVSDDVRRQPIILTVVPAGLHNDTVRGDPLFSIPLPSEYITDPELKSVQLCFEVHGQSGNHYNLISDKCTSVTALYSAGVLNTEMNVITKIGVRTQGTNGTCHSVKVDLDNCSASLDGAYVNKSSTASVDGVRLSARRSHIRMSVPNCEASRSIALWVTCTTRRSESLLEVVVSRGDGLEPTAHGVIGQFWNIPLKIEPYVGQYGERLVDLMDRFYSVTVSYPNAPERTFVAKYDERDWFDNRPCLYAGDADGGHVSEVPTSDSVIEGTANSYVVQDLFSTDFEFSKYNRDC